MREIELKSSPRLGLLLAGMAGLAGVALWAAVLPGAVRLLLGVAVAGLTLWGWHQARPRARLGLAEDGRLQGRDAAGVWRDLDVLGDSFVSTALIVLRYRGPDGRVHALTLLPDSADADALRRLRVSLRWAPRTRSDTASPDAG